MAYTPETSFKTFFRITRDIDRVSIEYTSNGITELRIFGIADIVANLAVVANWVFLGYITNLVVTKKLTGDTTGPTLLEATVEDLKFYALFDNLSDISFSSFITDPIINNEP